MKTPRMGKRRAVFRPDHKGFGEFIMSERMRGTTADVAVDIAAAAKGLAEPYSDTGDYADGFEVNREAGKIKVHRAFRVKVEVYNSDEAAAPNEFGGRSKKHPRRRTLARAGSLFGDFHGGKES